MAEFENHRDDALQISREIARILIALGIDWKDEAQMRALAKEALNYHKDRKNPHMHFNARADRSKLELFGLIGLMLRTMEEGADLGVHIHGSDVWKALAKALWEEKVPS